MGWQLEAYKAQLSGAFRRAADIYRNNGKWKKAVKFYVKAGLYDSAALLSVQCGDTEGALTLYLRDHRYGEAAELYEKTGKFTQAADCYMRAEEPSKAAGLLEKQGMHSKAAEIWLKAKNKEQAAAAYVRAKQPERAIPLLEEIIRRLLGEAYSKVESSPTLEKYASYCGRYYMEKKQYHKAAEHFEHAGLINEAAGAFETAGDLPKAIQRYIAAQNFEKASALMGEFKASDEEASQFGDILYELGHYDEAAPYFEQVKAYDRAADCYEFSGNNLQAAELCIKNQDFNRAAHFFAQAGDLKKAGAYFDQGGDFAQAAAAYREAGDSGKMAESFRKGEKYIEAAKCYLKAGETMKAIDALQEMPEGASGYREASFYLGRLFTQTQRYDLAMEKFKAAIGSEPVNAKNLDKYYLLAVCLESMEQYGRAREIYTRILSAKYGYKDVEERLDVLKTKAASAPPAPTVETVAVVRGDGAQPGQTLTERYEITETLGGTFYKGWDSSLGRVVGIKRFDLSDLNVNCPDYRDRIKQIAGLSHPHIAGLYDTTVRDTYLYLFMEYMTGTSLKETLKTRKTIPMANMVSYVSQLTQALGYAHGRDMIHGALHPDSVFITTDNAVKIRDYLWNTVPEAYIAPEVKQGAAPGKASDMYQLGMLVCECLLGQVPTTIDNPLKDLASCPDLVRDVMMLALSSNPKERPKAEDFARVFADLGVTPGMVLLDRYEVTEELGAGGMGKVFKCYDRDIGEVIALKVLRKEVSMDSLARDRFLREIKITRSITHPNVVRVFDIGRWEDQYFITMEYLDAVELFEHIQKKGPMKVDQGVNLFTQVCDGLHHAHIKKIIHRDIKPQNIVITKEGIPKILDFGIARSSSHDATSGLTSTGQLVGSPKYMSPEQILGKPLDVRSDVYAMGIVMYFAFTAIEPFDAETLETIVMRQIEKTPPPIRKVRPEFPEWLEIIIFKALNKTPAKRYPNALALKDALVAGHTASRNVGSTTKA